MTHKKILKKLKKKLDRLEKADKKKYEETERKLLLIVQEL
jgi:hypothetical protein